QRAQPTAAQLGLHAGGAEGPVRLAAAGDLPWVAVLAVHRPPAPLPPVEALSRRRLRRARAGPNARAELPRLGAPDRSRGVPARPDHLHEGRTPPRRVLREAPRLHRVRPSRPRPGLAAAPRPA